MHHEKTCLCQYYDIWDEACIIPAEDFCKKKEQKIKKVSRPIPLRMIDEYTICHKCLFYKNGRCTLNPKEKCIHLK